MAAPLLQADFDIEDVLSKIPLPGKIKLLCGLGWWHTEPVPEAGIPSMRMSDGPNGVRGTRFFNGVPASCFPSSTGLGSSFDVDLAYEVGKALGDECRAKSVSPFGRCKLCEPIVLRYTHSPWTYDQYPEITFGWERV